MDKANLMNQKHFLWTTWAPLYIYSAFVIQLV